MDAAATTGQHGASRISLILGQIDALPTLPSVASRLLQLGSAEDADFREIVSMIESDPALTAKILGLCRRADSVRSEDITTVDRAVVHLGFEQVRAAALSVHAYELLAGPSPNAGQRTRGDDAPPLDLKQFWRHSIAVACAAEGLVEGQGANAGLPKPASAFVCGLLHGVGILALEHALPRAYARALHIAERTGEDLASVERTLLGVDHHSAGRRLAEKWDLPPMLRDVIWLTGLPYEALPEGPNRNVVGLINAAVSLAREQHLGWSGDPGHLGAPEALCKHCGVRAEAIVAVRKRLHEEVAARATLLGINESDGGRLLVESLEQANHELRRRRESGARASAQASRQGRALVEAAAFRGEWAHSLDEAGESIARCAGRRFGATFVAVMHRATTEEPWSVRRYMVRHGEARALPKVESDDVAAPWEPLDEEVGGAAWPDDGGEPAHSRRGSIEEVASALGAPTMALHAHDLPEHVGRCVVIHDGADTGSMRPGPATDLTLAQWAGAIVSAWRAEELRRLRDETDSAGTEASRLRERLAALEAAAIAIEFAKQTTQETGRPMSLLRARAEVLQQTLTQQRDLRNVDAIISAAARMEALMEALGLTLEPPTAVNAPNDLAPLLGRAIREAMKRVGSNPKRASQPRIRLLVDEAVKSATLDGLRLAGAVTELVANCLEVAEVSLIEVDAHNDPETGRLLINVKDDGIGMTPDALAKALEPFALVKKNTQRKGLGLVMAERLMRVVGGKVSLANNASGKGLTATITVEQTSEESGARGAQPRQAA